MGIKRQTRKMRPAPLSPAWRAFFETGANGNETEEDGEIFIVSGSDEKIVEAFLPYREEILAEWKRVKREGIPCAEEIRLKISGRPGSSEMLEPTDDNLMIASLRDAGSLSQ